MSKSVVGRWRLEGGYQVLLGLSLMLGVCSLSVLGSCIRLLMPVLMYGSGKMIWKKEERSRIRAVQMDKIRSLLGIRRMDRVPNAWIREMYRTERGGDERIEEDVLHRFSHVERMENDRIDKRLYTGEFAGSSSAGQPR